MATRLARAFGAFRVAVNTPRNYYRTFRSKNLHEFQTPERALRMTFPYPDSHEAEDRKVTFTYDYRFDNTKLIFVATTTGGTKVLSNLLGSIQRKHIMSEMDIPIASLWVAALGRSAQLPGMFEWRPCGRVSSTLVRLFDHKHAAMSRTVWIIHLYLNRA